MRFPQTGFIDGVKSKGKPLMKMAECTYTYPVNNAPTVKDVTVQVSLASRVACVGPNGVGKSTMIKLLTGEVDPARGHGVEAPERARGVRRPARVPPHRAALGQDAERVHRWRYQHGDDKEALVKDTMTLTDEEASAASSRSRLTSETTRRATRSRSRWCIEKLTGGRKQVKKEYEYEVQFVGRDYNSNRYLQASKLAKWGFEKHMKIVDEKVAARAGAMHTPLTTANVEKHLEDVGLDKEFGTHTRMAALSGGQKVKVVIAGAMWNCPHIVILDEPTNYLDRDSLGALAGAIKTYEGGVVMITHNNEFCSALCPETWLMEKADDGIARCNCKGDAEWMAKAAKKDVTAAAALERVHRRSGQRRRSQEKELTRTARRRRKRPSSRRSSRAAKSSPMTRGGVINPPSSRREDGCRPVNQPRAVSQKCCLNRTLRRVPPPRRRSRHERFVSSPCLYTRHPLTASIHFLRIGVA